MDKFPEICYTETIRKEAFSLKEPDFSRYQEYQSMMRKIEKHNSFRLKSALFLLFFDIPTALIPLAQQYGLGFTVFALLYLAGILISFVFSVPETPKFCIIPAILILLGMVSGCVFFGFGILLLALLAWVIPDSKKLNFLKEQPGYPHFSERFDDQMQKFGKDYQPEHHFDHVHDAEMKDAFEETPAEQAVSSAQHIEMPDVPEISERSDFHE